MQTRRHGEIILQSASIPKGAKLVEEGKTLIVGHSETGHHHVMTLESVLQNVNFALKIFEFEGKTYLDIPMEAKLIHQKEFEKHETQIIPKGTYEFHPRKSYSYAEKIMKRVSD